MKFVLGLGGKMIGKEYSDDFIREYFNLPEGALDTEPIATIAIQRSGHIRIQVLSRLIFLLGLEPKWLAKKLRKIAKFYDSEEFESFVLGDLDIAEGKVGKIKYLADSDEVMIR